MVELARIGHGLGDGRLGDRVKGYARDIFGKRLLVLQHVLNMPAYRFALTVRVGCQDQAVGLLRLVGNRLQLPGLVGVIIPDHRKAVVRIDRTVLGRQIAHMAIGSEDLVSATQIFLDGLRFGG